MSSDVVECSFCGKTRQEVSKLVASDKGVAICDECLVVSFAQMIGSPVKFFTKDILAEAIREKPEKEKAKK